MDDDTRAIESLTHEMELTRMEMAALTDALTRLSHSMRESTAGTQQLATLIEESQRRGFWRRLFG
jgi:hypothetical protein